MLVGLAAAVRTEPLARGRDRGGTGGERTRAELAIGIHRSADPERDEDQREREAEALNQAWCEGRLSPDAANAFELGQHGTYHFSNTMLVDWASDPNKNYFSCETCGMTEAENFELLKAGYDTLMGNYSNKWLAESGATASSPAIGDQVRAASNAPGALPDSPTAARSFMVSHHAAGQKPCSDSVYATPSLGYA